MLDFSHIPTRAVNDQQVFIGNNANIGGHGQVWVKPRGISMVSILMFGQGNKGAIGAVGATAAGGLGGGSGAQSSWTGPAWAVPDIMYFTGGDGQTATAIPTVLACTATPRTTAGAVGDIILWAGGATGSTAGPVGTLAGGLLQATGTALFLAGQAGGAAGAATPSAGGNVAALTTGLLVMGGSGGGGMSASATAAGGTVTPSFPAYCTPALAAAGGSSGVDGKTGQNGVSHLFNPQAPFIFTGGAGGGSGFPTATTSNGGNGGNGGYGCGGGGGGGAVTGKTAGAAGFGGPGLCIITCW